MSVSALDFSIDHLRLVRRGKVRDTYDLGDELLMIATDRISAFDVILPTPIPRKGIVLTQLSRFWFQQTATIVPNHIVSSDSTSLQQVLGARADRFAGRAMIVTKAERIDIECVARGYLAGSAWQEYRASGAVAGVPLPSGMAQAQVLPEPLFTPAIKIDSGHDINISKQDLVNRVGNDLAADLERATLSLYQAASERAERNGIIIADTKLEFGFVNGELTLIDELLTPDSSRFWDANAYRPGADQPSFDKQFARDWLMQSGWDRQPPGPELPENVVAGTAQRYHEAFKKLTGSPLWLSVPS